MKILTFRGVFSWDKENPQAGLICWCHVQPGDNSKVERIARIIKSKRKSGEKIIIVPFAHLSHKIMDSSPAKDFFNHLIKSLPEGTVLKPFGISKELNLEVPPDDSAVKFLRC